MGGRRLHGHGQPVPAEHGGIDAAGDVPQLGQRRRHLLLRPPQPMPGRVVAGRVAEQAQLQRQRDQALLGAVVQVALQPLPLLPARLDHPLAGSVQILQPGPELGAQPPVLQGDPRRRGQRLDQLGLLLPGAVEGQRRHRLGVAVHHPYGLAVAQLRQRGRPALLVGPRVELGQPVGQTQRRVVQRAGERGLQVGRRVGAQLDEQPADVGAGQPGVHQAQQEHQRRQPECRERDVPDDLEACPTPIPAT